MTKKSTTTVRTIAPVSEELRVMASAETAATAADAPLTPEFLSLAGTVVVNLITAATVVGWIDASAAQDLTKSASAIVAAVSTIAVNGMLVWKYIAGRTAVKVEQISAQYRYMEVVAVERMRAGE
jgi:hypothetical protein